MSHNKLPLAALGLTSALLIGAPLFAADEPAQAEQAAPQSQELPDPVATVNGEPISKAMYKIYAEQRKSRLGNIDNPAARQALTEELITQELLVQEADKQNLAQDPEVALQLELVRRNLLATAAVRKKLKEYQPSEEDIQKEYENVAKAMQGTEYKASHILVDSEDEAKEIIQKLNEGADFAELAKKHSKDSSASRGGDLGWFTEDLMVKPFGDAVSNLKKGEYSKTPVQTQFGWHVIKLEDTRQGTPPSLEQLRPQLTQSLKGRVIQDYLKALREKAEIEIK